MGGLFASTVTSSQVVTGRNYTCGFASYTGFTTVLPRDYARVLAARGVSTAAQAQAVLSPKLSELTDPFELPGMSAAAGASIGPKAMPCGPSFRAAAVGTTSA